MIKRLKILCIVLTFLLAASFRLLAQEGLSTKILKLDVSGNTRSEKGLILATSGLTVGNDLTGDVIQDAVRRLYSLGIFDDINLVVTDQKPEGLELEIAVKEYPVLQKLSFEGNKAIKTKDLEENLKLFKDQFISPRTIKESLKKIQKMYEEKGYHLAKVKPETFESGSEGKVILSFHIDEGEKVQVTKIRILGTSALSEPKIKKEMKTKEKKWWKGSDFKKDVYQNDLTKIVDLYRNKGFRDAEISKDSLYYDESKRKLFIDITVKEGAQYRFGKIDWEGNTAFSNEEITKMVAFKKGEVYDQEKFDKTMINIYTAYREKGYLHTILTPIEIPAESGADTIGVHISLSEGTPAKVRMIQIVGNTKTKEKVIRRELSMLPGELFKQSALERSQRDVNLLNYFKEVKPDAQMLPNGDVDLIFQIQEKATGQATAGAGYSDTDGLIGSVGLMIPNLLGNGQDLKLNLDRGQKRSTLQLEFTDPWFLDTSNSLGLNIYRIKGAFDVSSSFQEKRQGGTISLGRRSKWPDNYSRMYFKYRFEEVSYFDFIAGYTDPYGLEKTKWPQRTSSIGITYSRDSRDLPEFPTTGSVFSYTVEFAGGPLAGNVSYQKHEINSEFYFPALWKAVLLFQSKLAYINNLFSKEEIPFSERFFPGGVSFDGMIRGYEDRSVGPVEKGEVIGGKTMFTNTIELQFPLAEQTLYGLIFADAGNAWRNPGETNPFDLKRSLGFGARVRAPAIGLIGFDVAYGFDNIVGGKRKGRWNTHFQFGRVF